jgi:phosphoglucosamine mutase
MPPPLFGTDGIRGRAGTAPLDPPTVRRIGAALVRARPEGAGPSRLLIGRDTRESGGWIERELAHGARSDGARVVSAGVIPTPAVAYLTRASDFTLGVVISASHNPFEDNGIKVFSGGGQKFTQEDERRVEAIVADDSWSTPEGEAGPVESEALAEAYLIHLRDVWPHPGRLSGAKVVVDCANGATTTVAPPLVEALGLDVTLIGAQPDGRNINRDCGSTHPERLAATVTDVGASAGVAFDGDGDRAIFVDERGQIVDGDAVMLMCAKRLRSEGRLSGDTVVATVMSNIGLEIALREAGITLLRTQVGDKHVMEELLRRNLSLGGEQSGHVIFTDYLFTGDGLATALHVLRTMDATGRTLSSLAGDIKTYPQVLVNVRVKQRADLQAVPPVAEAMARIEERLSGHGRLLVRYSGTEPLLRIMLEGRDQTEIQQWAEEIADQVRTHLA